MTSAGVVTLGDLVELTMGFAFKSEEFSENQTGIKLLRGENIAQGTTRWDNTRWWPTDSSVESKYALRVGDVALAMDRPWIDAGLKFATIRPSDLPALLVQRVALLRARPGTDQRYLSCVVSSRAFTEYVLGVQTGTSIPHISGSQIARYSLSPHTLSEQRAIAEVLGALDDKIAANQKLSATSASLSHAMFDAAVRAYPEEWLLSEITVLVTRGVTPSYSDADDTMMVLNQKCVRDQRIVLAAARRTLTSKVREDKILVPNDVLINSTGQGTLGRVARWTRNEIATTDSHVSIVRFDGAKTNKVVAGHGLLQLQSVIEEMGEGSTGQTELSRTELNKLRIRLPASSIQDELGLRLSELARMEDSSLHQNLTLAATRDALLPQLMSGKLRVKDAETVLEGVL